MVILSGAVEGDLDEVVLRRIVEYSGLELGAVYGRNGKPHLLNSLHGYNSAARFAPWIVLVDMDRDCDCAPICRQQWLPDQAGSMCFRIVVRALETWLLADRQRVAEWLGVSVAQVPHNPDELIDPKRELVNLARRSRLSRIRRDVVPSERSGRAVGQLYFARASEFIHDRRTGWRPQEALRNSNSLERCVRRLRELANA